MAGWLGQITNSPFVANVGKLFAGKGLAFAITLGSAPIISRLYTPGDYGVIGVFLSICSISTILATLKYENAAVLPADEHSARSLSQGALGLSLLFCVLMFGLVTMAVIFFPALEFIDKLGGYIWFLPAAIALMSASRLSNGWLIRHKDFSRMAQADIVQACVNTGIRIAAGLVYGSTVLGLLFGNLTGFLTRLLVVFPQTKNALRADDVKQSDRKNLLKEYSEFPRFTMPADFVRSLGQNLPILLFGFMYSPAVAGLFYMANRLIMAPVDLLLQAFRGVFLQKVAADKNAGVALRPIYLRFIALLAAIGIIPALLLYLYGQELLVFLLGEQWTIAGQFSEILAPLLFSFWISSPAAMLLIVLRKQNYWLLTQVLITTCQGFVFAYAWYFGQPATWALWGFVCVQVVINVLMKLGVNSLLSSRQLQAQ